MSGAASPSRVDRKAPAGVGMKLPVPLREASQDVSALIWFTNFAFLLRLTGWLICHCTSRSR